MANAPENVSKITGVPVEETGDYVPITPTATAVAVEYAQEVAIEAAEEAGESV